MVLMQPRTSLGKSDVSWLLPSRAALRFTGKLGGVGLAPRGPAPAVGAAARRRVGTVIEPLLEPGLVSLFKRR